MESGHPVAGIAVYPRLNQGARNKSCVVFTQNSDLNLKRLANISDDTILLSSINYAEEKSKKSFSGKLKNALPSLFNIVVPVAFGALQKGPLSVKAGSALLTGALFAGTEALFKGYKSTVDRAENASPSFEKKRNDHPVLSMAGDLAAKALLLLGTYFAISKGKDYFQNKFQPASKALQSSIRAASEKIDGTRLAKFTQRAGERVSKAAQKHPKIAGFLQKHSVIKPVAILAGWMGLSSVVEYKAQSDKCDFAAQRASQLLCARDVARSVIGY